MNHINPDRDRFEAVASSSRVCVWGRRHQKVHTSPPRNCQILHVHRRCQSPRRTRGWCAPPSGSSAEPFCRALPQSSSAELLHWSRAVAVLLRRAISRKAGQPPHARAPHPTPRGVSLTGGGKGETLGKVSPLGGGAKVRLPRPSQVRVHLHPSFLISKRWLKKCPGRDRAFSLTHP